MSMMNTALEDIIKAIAFVSSAIRCLETNKESLPDYDGMLERFIVALHLLESQKRGMEDNENNTSYTEQENPLYKLFIIINIYKPEKSKLDRILELDKILEVIEWPDNEKTGVYDLIKEEIVDYNQKSYSGVTKKI